MIKPEYKGAPAIVIGTGPSLNDQAEDVRRLKCSGYKLFGVNNTYSDFDLDVWIACDPAWHDEYSPVKGDFDKWHWDRAVCNTYGYNYIEGRWGDGLSTSPDFIHYGHSSGYQALNLALLYGCGPIYLCGYDMSYGGDSRHYFSELSGDDGEYPEKLRKYSTFDGLINCYVTVANQEGLPSIYNCTKDSGLTCFSHKRIEDL